MRIGDIFFYNNRRVVILDLKDEDRWAFVKGSINQETTLDGSNFCIACMIGIGDGSHQSHTCEDAQNVIDEVLSNISEDILFWVETRLLMTSCIEKEKCEKAIKMLERKKEELSIINDEIIKKSFHEKNIKEDIEKINKNLLEEKENFEKQKIKYQEEISLLNNEIHDLKNQSFLLKKNIVKPDRKSKIKNLLSEKTLLDIVTELVHNEYEWKEEISEYGYLEIKNAHDSFSGFSLITYCEPEDAIWHRDLQHNFYTGIEIGIRNTMKVIRENEELLESLK